MSNERFVLMHKDVPVMDCVFDGTYLVSIGYVHSFTHLPVIQTRFDGKPAIADFADWWYRRAVPKHRHNLKIVLRNSPNAYKSIDSLISVNLGLGLSDQYWMKPVCADVSWNDVNFFHNDFGCELSDLLLDNKLFAPIVCVNPSSILGGDVPKAWKIYHGERYMVKASSLPYKQEAINEVIGSRLCKLLGIPCIDYVYHSSNNMNYSFCKCGISDNEDIVSMYDILNKLHCKSGDELSTFKNFLAENNIKDIMDDMIAIDFIIGNYDRHLSNVCVVRNAETGEFVRMFPVFDFGNSLGYRDERIQSTAIKNLLTGHMYGDDLRRLKIDFRNDKLSQIPSVVQSVCQECNYDANRSKMICEFVAYNVHQLSNMFDLGVSYYDESEFSFT